MGLPFQPGFGEDRAWAERVKATGLVRSEVFIPAELYHYRYSTSGSLFAGGPRHLGSVPELPEYAHVSERPTCHLDCQGGSVIKTAVPTRTTR